MLPSDLDGPGSYRCLFPALALKQNTDWDVSLCKFSFIETPKGQRVTVELPEPDSADVFVIQRRFESQVTDFAKEAQRLGKTVLASTDDDDINLPPWHSAFGKGQGGSENVNRIFWHRTVQAADALICSTPALARAYRKLNPKSHVVKNYLDWRMWREVNPVYEERPWDRLRIGWLGDPKLRDGDIRLMGRFLRMWLLSNPGVDFVSSGSEKTHALLGIPESQRITIPGVPFQHRKLHTLLQFDIGLVPLTPCPFNEAKSHLKGLEYAARGIPSVASETASYRDWLGDGRCGFLAHTPQEWTDALDRLVADGDLRRRMGAEARAKARENSLDRNWGEWHELYSSFGDRPHDRPADTSEVSGVDRAAA